MEPIQIILYLMFIWKKIVVYSWSLIYVNYLPWRLPRKLIACGAGEIMACEPNIGKDFSVFRGPFFSVGQEKNLISSD